MSTDFLTLFIIIVAIGAFVLVLLGGMYIGRRQHRRIMEFNPRELHNLSPQSKAILLKHKDKILKPLEKGG